MPINQFYTAQSIVIWPAI